MKVTVIPIVDGELRMVSKARKEGIGNQKTRDHLDHSTVKISENA